MLTPHSQRCLNYKCLLLFIAIINSSIVFSQDSFDISKLRKKFFTSTSDSIKAIAGYDLGTYYIDMRNDSAYYFYDLALKSAENIEFNEYKSYIYHNLGYRYDTDNDYKKALECYLESEKYYTIINDTSGVAQIYNNIGYSYMSLYAEKKAIEYYLKSLSLFKQINDEEGVATNLSDIGGMYYDFKNYDFAIKKYNEALEIYKKLNDEEGIAMCYTNIGNAVAEKGDDIKGLEYFFNSIEIQKRIKDTLGVAINYNNIGDSYIHLKQYEKALSYFKESLKIAENNNDQDLISIIYLNIADVEIHMEKYHSAIKSANISLKIAKKIGNIDYSSENYESLAIVYEKLGNKTLALKYLNEYKRLNDSIQKIDRVKKIQLFDALVDIENSQFKIQELANENKITELKYENGKKIGYFLIVSTIIFGVLMILLYYQFKSKKKANNLLSFKNREIKRMNNEIMLQSSHLKKLNETKDKFLSIIAHDLKNPFNAIKGFTDLLIENIDEYDVEKQLEFLKIINDSSITASELLDNLLTWANSQAGSLKFEPKQVHLFSLVSKVISLLEIQAFNKNIKILNKVDSNTYLYADENMLETVVRNILTNALKFSERKGVVQVSSTNTGNSTEIIIKDEGIGMTQETIEKLFVVDKKHTSVGTENEKGTGLGLIICKDFVEKHGGTIDVYSELSKGSEFKFKFPHLKAS